MLPTSNISIDIALTLLPFLLLILTFTYLLAPPLEHKIDHLIEDELAASNLCNDEDSNTLYCLVVGETTRIDTSINNLRKNVRFLATWLERNEGRIRDVEDNEGVRIRREHQRER